MFVRNDSFVAYTVACSLMMTGALYAQDRKGSMNTFERKMYQKEIQLNAERPLNQAVSVDYRYTGGTDPKGSYKAFSDEHSSADDEMNLFESRY